MRLNKKTEEMLCRLARDIKRLYHFSLMRSEPDYTDIEEIAELLGGGILYSHDPEPEAARCGKGFIIKLPYTDDEGERVRSFAEALAVLFVKYGYIICPKRFSNLKNMEFTGRTAEDYEVIDRMKCCLLADPETVKKAVEENCDINGDFYRTDVAETLGTDKMTASILLPSGSSTNAA